MDKHTPTPWSMTATACGNGVAFEIYANGACLASVWPIEWDSDEKNTPLPCAENATLIVEAVNSHASLLSTINELMEALDDLVEVIETKAGKEAIGDNIENLSKPALSRAKSLMEQKP